MSDLDPETEAQIIDDFGKYEGIRIERLDDRTVKASFQEFFGEGSATGNSILNVLIAAVRRQKNHEYWHGYAAAQEKQTTNLEEQVAGVIEQLDQLTQSVNQLRATTDTAIKHLAGHVSHLALQFQIDHQQPEQESD